MLPPDAAPLPSPAEERAFHKRLQGLILEYLQTHASASPYEIVGALRTSDIVKAYRGDAYYDLGFDVRSCLLTLYIHGKVHSASDGRVSLPFIQHRDLGDENDACVS